MVASDLRDRDNPVGMPNGLEHQRLLEQLKDLLDRHELRSIEPVERHLLAREAPTSADPRQLAQKVAKFQRQHQLRSRFVSQTVAAEPAWPMLLDLFLSELDHKPATTEQLTCAAAVPGTTALRWINIIVRAGYAERHSSGDDRRLALLRISARGFSELESYFRYLDDHGLA